MSPILGSTRWSFVSDYGRAVFIGLGVCVGPYFVSIALRASEKAPGLLPWLVFGRFDAGDVMARGASLAADTTVLLAYAVVGIAVACGIFRTRDLRL
jgi:hypothetical protein